MEQVEVNPIVSIKDIRYSVFNQGIQYEILRDISISIAKGEIIVLLGSSGVGKTTLLRIISQLIIPSHGSVIFNTQAQKNQRLYGYVFQEPRLLPWRRVLKNVLFGLEEMPLKKKDKLKRAEEVLSMVKLTGLEHRWPYQLSGGQMQRVSIARALVVHPKILLMDEPFSSLDVLTRAQLQNNLLEIQNSTGTSIFFVTHDISEAIMLADRIFILQGSPAVVADEIQIDLPHPRSKTSKSFINYSLKIHQQFS